jgi:signal transduction histidine kinase
MEALRVLLVEDNPGDARLIRELLREAAEEFDLAHVDRISSAVEAVDASPPDVVLLDLSLPDAQGMVSLQRMLEAAPEAAVVILTGLDDREVARRALGAGAQDYLVKGEPGPELLSRTLRYAFERKQLERERARLLREARQAVAARDEVLHVVSHDLGNSLSAIGIHATLLLRAVVGMPEGVQIAERAQAIRRLVDQMHSLRQDLLDVAAIEAGGFSVETRPVPPASLVEGALEALAGVAEERGLTLTTRCDDSLPRVQADERRVLQLLGNLLGNACKFTPSGGTVEVIVEAAPEGVLFHVADSGSGVPEEKLPYLFDRFWQLHQTRRGSAGLGLAIAKGIVEAHGGWIRARSTAGEGTTFTFLLPTAA